MPYIHDSSGQTAEMELGAADTGVLTHWGQQGLPPEQGHTSLSPLWVSTALAGPRQALRSSSGDVAVSSKLK